MKKFAVHNVVLSKLKQLNKYDSFALALCVTDNALYRMFVLILDDKLQCPNSRNILLVLVSFIKLFGSYQFLHEI